MDPQDGQRRKRGSKRNVRPRNGLTGKPTPHGKRAAKQAARAAEAIATRRQAVWRAFTKEGNEHLGTRELGKLFGVSNATIHRDLMAIHDSFETAGFLDPDNLRLKAHVRLQRVIGKHMPKADRVESAKVVLAATDQEMRLHGYAKRPQATYTVEQVVAALTALTRDLLAAFTEAEDRRRIAEVIRRRLPQGTVLDAPPAETGEERTA